MEPKKETDMELYAGIDLHSNNCVVYVLDAQDKTVFAKRLPNDLAAIVAALRTCAGALQGVAVESTYNWYWLVDGLQDEGFRLHLVNTAAVKQYDGLKHGGDFSDARHLAHLLRLGILPTGYIYPREQRAVRDLMRKRSQLVRLRSTQILSMQNLLARNLGSAASGNEIKRWQAGQIAEMPLQIEQRQALQANLAVMHCLGEQIKQLESSILGRDRTLRECWPLCLLRTDGGQSTRIERQEERRRQRQVRQPVLGLGLRRSGPLCHPLRRGDQALVSEEVCQHAGGGCP
jgi:transposase